MDIKIKKQEYIKIIEQDLEYLNDNCKGGDTILDHIREVLYKSIDLLYPIQPNDNSCPDGNQGSIWRDDLATYLSIVRDAREQLLNDKKFKERWMKYNPKCNYELTVQKAYDMFWGTEDGWLFCKKKRKSKSLNMYSALRNTLDKNRVYNYQVETAQENKTFNKDKYISDRLAVIEEKIKKGSEAKKWQ